MIYIILGMHKSGTTLISQMLHKSGINMGVFNEDQTYDEGNKYERYEAQEINHQILNCGNNHSLDVIQVPYDRQGDDAIGRKISELINLVYSTYDNWGFKDPRTCLTYPLWQKYLPPHKIIFIYRSPLEIWYHYQKYIPRYKIDQRIIHGYKAIRAWHVYNNQLITYMQEITQSHIILNFSKFMCDSSMFDRLEAFVEFPLSDCRKKTLYRSKLEPDLSHRLSVFFRDEISHM